VQLALDSISFNEGGDLIGAIDEAGALTLSGTVSQTDESSGALASRTEVRLTARADGAAVAFTGDLVEVTGPPCMLTMTSSVAAARRLP
jgi:hypothetical protein